MSEFKRIAIHHPPGIAIWEDVLKGIFQFARPDLPWLMAANFDRKIECIEEWKPDGIIAQCVNEKEAKYFLDLGVPVINVAREQSGLNIPSVQIDDFAVGQMAARYFLDRGFTNLACFSLSDREFMRARKMGFHSFAADQGAEVELLEASEFSSNNNVEPPSDELKDWLERLPHQTGVFATTDALGVALNSACRFVPRKIPDELALLGASNNELLCNLEYPPLSSIGLPGQRLGFEAAKRLHAMMNGQSDIERATLLPPIEVVNRQSSDIYCIDDSVVSSALDFIRDNFQHPINVASVVKATDISRSGLERRFRKLLGRSILEELVNLRIKSAKRMLVRTDHSLALIAENNGFTNPRQFSTIFKKHTGEQPSAFRIRMTAE